MASEKREIEIALKSKGAESGADRLNTKVKGVGKSADGAESSMSKLRAAAVAVGAALAASKVTQYADAWTSFNNQIKQATSSTKEALAVQEAIFQIAKSSRVEIGGVADAYQRIYNSVEQFGFGAGDTLDVVEGLTKAFKANGASAAEVSSVLVQLGQGLGAGALQGQELNSIMEASLPVSKAIAAEFGVQVGQLKDLGAAGELVTDRVFKALQNSLPEFQGSFNKASATVADGMTVAGNSVTRLIGLTSDATGASQSFANGLIELSSGIDALGDAVQSGAAGKIADVFRAQLSQIADDINKTTDFIFNDWQTMNGALGASTDATTAFIGDAFLNIIPNVRQLVQVITVEMASAIDKLAVYGDAVAKTLNPFDDVSVDQARGYFGRQIAQIDEVRESSIQSIFDQREVEKTAQTARINEANELLEVYKKQREERKLTLESPQTETSPVQPATSASQPQKQGSGAGSSFIDRLKLETEQLQAELEVRRQLNVGYITEQQANDAIELQNLLFNYESKRQTILEQEFQTETLRQEALAALREQELEAIRLFEASKTDIKQEADDDRLAIEEAYSEQVKSLQMSTFSNAVDLMSQLIGESKASAVAGIAIQTASAFAANQASTAAAATLAYASQLIPGDPTSIARATAAAAKANALGQFNGGLIVAAGALKAGGALSSGGSASTGGGSVGASSVSAPVAATPSVDNQSQNRTINITGLDGFDDDQPIPLTVGGLKSLLSSNEDVNIAINQGQQTATRLGAI